MGTGLASIGLTYDELSQRMRGDPSRSGGPRHIHTVFLLHRTGLLVTYLFSLTRTTNTKQKKNVFR